MAAQPTTTRWLRNHREIARRLRLKPSQNQLRTIGEWIARPEFPKKTRKGFAAEEVEKWYLGFALAEKERMAPFLAAREIIAQKRVPGKRALAELERGAGGNGAMASSGPIPSQAAMAVELQTRYGLPIKRQTVCNWIHGIHLPPGAARFPSPDPGRAGWNNPAPCYEWYEQWIVRPTQKSAGELQGNLFEQKKADAIMAEFEEQIDKARKAKAEANALEREVSEKWIPRADARATATRAINEILHIVDSEYERSAPQRRREKLSASLPPAVTPEISAANTALLNSFYAWDMADERERIDRIRAACRERADSVETQSREGAEPQINTDKHG